jgi:hypothetical protein
MENDNWDWQARSILNGHVRALGQFLSCYLSSHIHSMMENDNWDWQAQWFLNGHVLWVNSCHVTSPCVSIPFVVSLFGLIMANYCGVLFWIIPSFFLT